MTTFTAQCKEEFGEQVFTLTGDMLERYGCTFEKIEDPAVVILEFLDIQLSEDGGDEPLETHIDNIAELKVGEVYTIKFVAEHATATDYDEFNAEVTFTRTA